MILVKFLGIFQHLRHCGFAIEIHIKVVFYEMFILGSSQKHNDRQVAQKHVCEPVES